MIGKQRCILAGDFNTVDSNSKLNVGGTEDSPPITIKDRIVKDFLSRWGFKDILNKHNLDSGLDKNKHLTHWNQENTRGRRLDRVYFNFEHNCSIKIKTIEYLWSDHKEIVYSIEGLLAKAEALPAKEKRSFFPKRALNTSKKHKVDYLKK